MYELQIDFFFFCNSLFEKKNTLHVTYLFSKQHKASLGI